MAGDGGLFAVVVDVDLQGACGLGKDAIELDETPPGHSGVEDGQDAAIAIEIELQVEGFDGIFGDFSDRIVTFGLFHPRDIDLPEAVMGIPKDSGAMAGPEDAQELLGDVVPALEVRGPDGNEAMQMGMIVVTNGVIGDFEAAHDAFEGALKMGLLMKRVAFWIEAVAKERAAAPVEPIAVGGEIVRRAVWERKGHVKISEPLWFKGIQDTLGLAVDAETSAPLAHGTEAITAEIGADEFAILIEFDIGAAFPEMAGAVVPAGDFLHGRSDKSSEFLVLLESF